MVHNSGEGHIPSSYSIVDIIHFLYKEILSYDIEDPEWKDRDYFILSKGHGCGALWAVLRQFGFITEEDLLMYSKYPGILGGHPDAVKVPGVEASTGSLGHGFPYAVGIALGLKVKSMKNKVVTILGDGECQEGTVWEACNIAANRHLGNICAIVDWNKSAQQLMPIEDLDARWKSFGWNTKIVNGHSDNELRSAFNRVKFDSNTPTVIIADNVKGKGVSFTEGHGIWHHRVPTPEEMETIKVELGVQ
jgi:transketolase